MVTKVQAPTMLGASFSAAGANVDVVISTPALASCRFTVPYSSRT